jgi:hypothetical protein
MNPIKIRYTWKRKSDGRVWQQLIDIDKIEGAIFFASLFSQNELISRDLFTGRWDKNGEKLYENDTLKFKNYQNVYKIGFEEGCFDIINFDNYSHDQQIAFEDSADWEKIGDIYIKP